MKTKSQNQKSELKNRPERLNIKPLPRIDLAMRRANRALNTNRLLVLLRSDAPDFFQIAEIVGRWVWITFPEKQPSNITWLLAELGFHWNNARQTWQHPCGTIINQRADYDPCKRYSSYFAASKTV